MANRRFHIFHGRRQQLFGRYARYISSIGKQCTPQQRRERDAAHQLRRHGFLPPNIDMHKRARPTIDDLTPHFRVASDVSATQLYPFLESMLQGHGSQDPQLLMVCRDIMLKAHHPCGSNLSQRNYQQLSVMKKQGLVYPSLDKGKGRTSMTQMEYDGKIMQHLHDHSTYRLLTQGGLLTHQNQLYQKLQYIYHKLTRGGDLSSQLRSAIRATLGPPSRFYGMAKVHKPAVPLRPVVAMLNPAYDNLSRYLKVLIKPYMVSPFVLKNALDLLERLRTCTPALGFKFFTLDVVSMYTNIPTDEALQRLRKLLEDDPLLSTKTQLSPTTIINLLKFICDHTTFTYQQQLYHQIRGLPMGGRLSAFLASICMNSFDSNINLLLPPQSLYVRYMDDILVYTSAEPQTLLDVINAWHPSIQFKLEQQPSLTAHYLDLTVSIVDNAFTTAVYHKPTETGRTLHWTSATTMAAKKSALLFHL
ncbi:MAG: hypothetical protein GY820_29710, partial [Gammaproteobacteria bacterium]|nr:hypothetical protein [Gammaproteobacteria bacterium]